MEDIQALDAKLKKMFGKNFYGMGRSIADIEYVPTGCSQLDTALGGGWPKGRLIELYGAPSSGKTTLANHGIRTMQRQGKAAAFINVERALDKNYMEACGVDVDELLVVDPSNAEEALEAARIMLESGAISILVIDSIASLTPSAEYTKEVGAASMAVLARMLGSVVKQLINHAASNDTIIIAINQLRAANLGGYGPSKDTPGGAAIKYHSSLRLEMSSKDKITKGSDIVGLTSQVKVTKNKVGIPFQTCLIDIMYPPSDFIPDGQTFYGIDDIGSSIDEAAEKGILEIKGSWIKWGEFKIQGKDKFRVQLFDDKKLLEKLRLEILNGTQESSKQIQEDDGGGVEEGSGELSGGDESDSGSDNGLE